jgi:hypothetical protein
MHTLYSSAAVECISFTLLQIQYLIPTLYSAASSECPFFPLLHELTTQCLPTLSPVLSIYCLLFNSAAGIDCQSQSTYEYIPRVQQCLYPCPISNWDPPHSPVRGCGGSQVRRLEKKPSTLSFLCCQPSLGYRFWHSAPAWCYVLCSTVKTYF